MAKATSGKVPALAAKIPFDALVALLGKPVDDPGVQKVLAKAGKVKVDSDFVVAKEAGFDVALDRPPGAKKKVLHTLFLFSPGADGHAGYPDLPAPFAFADRAVLRAKLAPDSAWTLDDGDVPPTHPESERDTWKRPGFVIDAEYDGAGFARHFTVQLPEEEAGGREIATHPLHFETAPADAPKDAELVGMGLLVAWAIDRFGLPKKHAGTDAGARFARRALSPVEFVKTACAKTLATTDVDPRLADFLYGYTHRLFTDSRAPNRAPTAKAIQKLLALPRADERYYVDDFLGTFRGVLKSPYHVPDSWQAVDRIAPVLDARWADFEATAFKAAPDLARYEAAAKRRDAVAITAATAKVAEVAVDDALALALVGLIGTPVKEAKPTLERAGLPIGKRVDEQANPAAGISYMAANLKQGGKPVLTVTDVGFHAAKQKSYIRGLGKEVEFRGYAGTIALGVAIGSTRAEVAKAFGKPSGTSDDYDYWYPSRERRISARFGKSGKLVMIKFMMVEDWQDKPKPPFGPAGIFEPAKAKR